MEYYLIPFNLKQYYINDIFYNSENETLYIIIIGHTQIVDIKYYDVNNKNMIDFKKNICGHNHTYIYYLKNKFSNNEPINIIINKNIVSVKISNFYPLFKDEIIMSTLVKNEDDYIIPWIDFHHRIGITRFIIYDNSEKNTLGEVLKEYILKNIVVLIKWSYDYEKERAQQTHQNHSIYAFQSSKYIGFFDIDEYINIQKKININVFLNELIQDNNIDTKKISCFRLLNKFFYNSNNLEINNNNFLYIFNCDNITQNGHEKCFVIPINTHTFSVHMVTNGLPMYNINEKYIYFNHYFFLNKKNRGLNKTNLIDKTILLHL